MARLSQKMVEAWFKETCRNQKIPLYEDRNNDNSKYRTGALRMSGAYGRIQVQFVYPKSTGVIDLSGYLNAREMSDYLRYTDLKAAYNARQKQARESLKWEESRR